MGKIETIRAFVSAWCDRDLDAIMAHMVPDARYTNIGSPQLVGHDRIRAWIGGFLAPVTRSEWTIHHIAETPGGAVLTERTDIFHFEAGTVTLDVMGVFEFDGDLISAWRDYYDTNSAAIQMGILQS